jgi:hypothetical protein
MIRQVHLDGVDDTGRPHVDGEGFAAPIRPSSPPCPDVLVDCGTGVMPRCRGCCRREGAIGLQHPPRGESRPGIGGAVGHDDGVVAEVLVAEEDTVVIEAGRKEADPALEVMVDGYPHSGGVPPVAMGILKGAAVSRARDEPTRL